LIKTVQQENEVINMRRRSECIYQILRDRLDIILPLAMRENEIDMWLILCQEDNLDPVHQTMLPMDCWPPILQILVFFDQGPEQGIRRVNISGTDTKDLFERPYRGQEENQQWEILTRLVAELDPKRIGINIGSVQWSAGGLTYNLYQQLVQALPAKYVERLVCAEPACTRWLETLTPAEQQLYPHIVSIARQIIARCYSKEAIQPGVTTITDLRFFYWQQCADRGLELAFLPYFRVQHSPENLQKYGTTDQAIYPGDMVHCDVGIRYMGYNSDHQEWAYILPPGETEAPAGFQRLLQQANRLQDVFMAEFKEGMTGNELLAQILLIAREKGIPQPKVYSHSLGLKLHEPGPLIGLPWQQERCPGRGDVKLVFDSCFSMELSVTDIIPEWDNQEFRLSVEQDVLFTRRDGCRVIHSRQSRFHLV
jgi:Xaa-Pro aminopeptidase